MKYQADLARWSVCGSTYCTSATSINRHTDNWIIKCCLVVCPFLNLFLCTSVVSATRINSFSILHTHKGTQKASLMHLRLFYTSYFAFQGRRTASDFSPASMLSHWFPITLELFWREADYTSTASRSLWPRLFLSAPPSHTRLTFCCSCCSVASTCIWVSLLFASIFDSGFLSHTSACRMCVNVWERGGRENGYTWWIMHGVVSWSARQTVGTANCPSGPFFFLFFFPTTL